ncbi:MAG: hypothetical protein WKF84_13810 [Pyrinomonadaceae bacterium]
MLPDYSAVIFDEAHLIEDIASEYFGPQITNYQIEDLLRDLQTLPVTNTDANREPTRTGGRNRCFADSFWSGFRNAREDEGRFPHTSEHVCDHRPERRCSGHRARRCIPQLKQFAASAWQPRLKLFRVKTRKSKIMYGAFGRYVLIRLHRCCWRQQVVRLLA